MPDDASDDAPSATLRASGLARAKLLARIHREFETSDEMIDVGGRPMPFTRVKDPDAVLDAICEQETARQRGVVPKRTLRMPYWAAVWESALALANFLAERDRVTPLADQRVLDLGCGMGMAGAAMALLGARVTLADIETACLLFARLNTLPWADRCRVIACDWQRDDIGERFDVIVGADVLYEVEQWPFIEAFARRHLRPGGTLIIGEPGRPKAVIFPDWLRERGWQLSTTLATGGGRQINVHIAESTSGNGRDVDKRLHRPDG